MALVSFQDRRSFGEELDRLVNEGRLTRAEADDKIAEGREAARIFNGAGITGMVLLVAGITTAAVGHGIAPDETSVEVAPVSMGDGYGLLGTVRF